MAKKRRNRLKSLRRRAKTSRLYSNGSRTAKAKMLTQATKKARLMKSSRWG